MKLYVNGQDIRQLVVGDVDQGTLTIVETEPEGYLKALAGYLKEVTEIYAVVGPGSATALRSILTILQTIHFVQGTPLLAIQKSPEEDDVVTIKRAIADAQPVETLTPIYQHSPRITISNKDALGRSKNLTPHL